MEKQKDVGVPTKEDIKFEAKLKQLKDEARMSHPVWRSEYGVAFRRTR